MCRAPCVQTGKRRAHLASLREWDGLLRSGVSREAGGLPAAGDRSGLHIHSARGRRRCSRLPQCRIVLERALHFFLRLLLSGSLILGSSSRRLTTTSRQSGEDERQND